MPRNNSALAAILAAGWLLATPVALQAQKALVYCPVGIDATGCNVITAALSADASLFPGGVDAGYDGSQSTVDLATADLSTYAVFVVPSLADGPDTQPYGLLRDATIGARLKSAFVGRTAVWSGTPDVGSTNRSAKDGLIRNLARWARPDSAGTHGPGLVVLEDNSDDAGARYGWLGAMSALSVGADTTFDVYSNVQVLSSTGQVILTNGGLQIAYTNMASYGLVAGPGGKNDATGGRSSRVVLVTAAGEPGESSIATVSTNREDYSPGDTVIVTGGGWEPGETVSLLFHEDVDPPIHPDRTLTAVADGSGQILNQEYVIDEEDVGIQFILTATGLTSGRTAQTTFTDGNKLLFNTAAFSVPRNTCSPIITVQMFQGNNPENGAPTPVALSSSSAGGAFFSNAACTTSVTSVTIPTSASTASFFYKDANTGSPVITAAAGTGCSGGNCTVTQTETITGPDLTITKTHAGDFTVGTAASYTITVTNSGTSATSGTVTVTDVQPAGLTFSGATGTGWTCGGTTTITCTRSNALAAGASYPAITLNVTPTTAGTVTNVASVSGGGETNPGNDSASDPTTVVAAVDLTISKSHTGNFTLGSNGTYTLTATNSGGTATTGTVTVTDVLPTGLGFVSATGGGTWSCGFATGTVTCTRSNAIGAGASAPAITLTVSVAEAAFPSVTNTASVSGGGEPAANNGNNSDSDLTTVVAPNLAIDKSHTGNFTQGVNGSYTLTVSNAGGAATTGTVTVTDLLPTGLGFVSAAGTGWTCNFAAGTVTCTRTTAIAAAGAAPAITLTVSVAAAAVPSVTNTASVSGGGEPAASNGNNSDSDPTTVVANNQPPVVDAGGPYTGNEGSAIALNTATATDPDAGDTPTYKWTYAANGAVDAGTSCSFTDDAIVQPTFTCNDDGAFTLTLTVDDQHGHVVADNAAVTVSNVKPTATAGGPYSGNEGAAIQLAGSGDDPAANDDDPKLTYKWSVNAAGIDAGGTCTFDDDTKKDAKITCTDDGAFTVTLVATDDDGAASTGSTANLTVNNVKPVAEAGGPYSGNEGAAIPVTGSATDVGTNDAITYKWTADVTGIDAGGTCTFGNDTHASTTVTCTDDGSFKVKLTATDDDGDSSFEEVALTVANVDPVADAGGPYNGNEGAAISLNGTVTDDGSNDTHEWSWQYVAGPGVDAGASCQFDDATAEDPKITCTDDGQVKLTLKVTDDNGGEGTDEAMLTLANVPPTAHANGPYEGDEGSGITLAGSATDPASNDVISYKWTADVSGLDAGGVCSFDDDTKPNAVVTCTDDGTVTLTLKATDDDNGFTTSNATLTVKNVVPVADAGGPYNGNEGSAVQLSGSETDAGANDTHTWSWQYVAGAGVDAGATCSFDDATAVNPKITCTDDGEVKLTLKVKDDDGGEGTDEAILNLANVAPTANAHGPYSGNEGDPITLAGSATDPASNDVISYKWTANVSGLDAGAACLFDDDTKPNAVVTCDDDGAVTLTLKATDDDGDYTTSNATLTLANVDPVANAGGPYSGKEGEVIPLNGSVTDAGAHDTHEWSWQYVAGPGVDAGATCHFSDPTAEDPTVYCTDDGQVKLTLKVTDDDGGEGTAEATLTLTNVAPTAKANGPYSGTEGGAISLNGSQTDPGANDTFTYLWTVNTAGIDAGGSCSFDDATKKNAKVTCTDDGSFTLTLKVTDDDLDYGTEQTTLTVQNANPVAASGGAYSGNEGAQIQLNGSATDAGSNDPITYKWVAVASGIDAGGTCSFDDDTKKDAKVTCTDDSNGGTFTLTLTAHDDDGGSGSISTTLTLQNVKPTITALTKPDGSALPTTIIVAGTLTIKVQFGDPASNDTHTAQIDCGSGYGAAQSVTTGYQTSCTFATIGNKTIKVKVTDDDGLSDEVTHSLTVKYSFLGFSAPVDRPNTMNVSKAGQAIPLKWQLFDANGAPVTNLTAVDIKISSLSCGGNVPTDLIEEYASGASGLKNMGGGNYQFNWKTPTNYVGSCKNIGLDFGSGYVELALANFNFKS